MLDVLHPKVEQQFKSWGSCIPEGGNTAPGERLSEVILMLRSKFRNYVQTVIEKLAENDVLSFLESRKENQSWYKGSRIAVSILDDTFASQMQQLLGNSLQEKDLEPPRSILKV
ncbi:hypothetical protein FXO38_06514 [Capsicum annuum]|uniref:Uncharacterized protein n=1 Tax=Capsicum annuum TaxID=4072 RepID=A0A2G2YJR0_CAPAN|nr:hypothetical protein FXO38_06514 [Capsicum annuum]KAF3680736.1 hypothetical protein FXO37_03193 [Capsicum annuum]PHT69970.1 hypothetical protein T459_25074 [Capsicum annuum]